MPYAFPLVNQAFYNRTHRKRARISQLSIAKPCCTIIAADAKSITTAISSKTANQKSDHLVKAAEYYSRAKQLIEVDQDWQASGSMILKALAEERKSENTGLQVMNVIKYQKPKTKLEFNFRS